MDLISSPALERITTELDRLTARQTVVAANIANIDTPGYKAKDVEFSRQLGAALNGGGSLLRTHPQHLGGSALPGGGRVVELGQHPARLDGNDVSLDREAAKLAEITLTFSAAAQMYMLRFRTIRQAILEGR